MDDIRILDDTAKKQRLKVEQLCREIDERQAALAATLHQRNSLVPISSLPPEILGHIFALVQYRDLSCNTEDRLDWIALTHVCWRWRDIALNLPSLWVDLPTDYPEWVEEMIQRSKTCGLTVYATVNEDCYETNEYGPPQVDIQPGLITALTQIHRIRDLSLHCKDGIAWHSIQCSVDLCSAPRLEKICLNAEELTSENDYIYISKNILRDTSALRQLQLIGCCIDWSSHPLFRCHSLTHLSLQDMLTEYTPTAKAFVDALKAMPVLQTLDLRWSFPDGEEWDSKMLHIPHLQNLHIEADSSDSVGFFRHISFPPSCIVKIVLYDNKEIDCSSFARSYSNASPEIIFRTLALKVRPLPTLHFQLELFVQSGITLLWVSNQLVKEYTPHLDYSHKSSPNLSGPGQWTIVSTHLIPQIFNCELDLSNIECIILSTTIPTVMPEQLAVTLGGLVSLRIVIGEGPGARTLLDAMCVINKAAAPTTTSTGNAIDSVYLLQITSIYFRDVAFVEQDVLEEENLDECNKIPMKIFREFLVLRRDLGAAIQILTLRRDDGVSEEYLQILEEIGVNVEFE
ncbi:hypothetical protein BDN70DRAFT_205371 [Pholiota conissans]|uniref:F-box domain-containing protein n=1 Tax=Pholiota conissans TaxID=109636 RepID=A0A9P6CWQ6_9AGAR|nr:hypothetical protein BDN70DRAFT_205371 [Pholiota conissans]